MDEDDGFATSDAEIDSEIEDTDPDGELSIWLDQLNSYTQEDPGALVPKKPLSPQSRVTFTPKQVMDSFRCSILEGGEGQDVDLDAILGELCDLETTLTTQKSEISSSMINAGIPEKKSPTSDSEVKFRENKDFSKNKDRDSIAELQCALDHDLQSALSELSDLVGIDFRDTGSSGSVAQCSKTFPDEGQGQTTSYFNQVPNNDLSVQIPSVSKPAIPNGNCRNVSADVAEKQVPHYQDYSPDGADADSAFSDSSSLPSSGSHVSVITTSSQGSNGSGGSSGSSGIGVTGNVSAMYGIYEMDSIKEHLRQFQKSLEKQNLPPAEQASKLKAEKVRIALEKIKEANIQKLFVRFYSEDGCSKSILVDDKMAVTYVCERLITKNNVTPSTHWAIVEHLPELFMERLLEDHELMVEPLLMWTRDSTNKLLFVQSPGKYDIFERPEVYLSSDRKEGEHDEATRQALIQEYFSGENVRFPEVEGHLYLKSEGKKAWKKFFFVLRASGLYYSPKGKGKTSKDLVCLQKLDVVEVYTAIAWKKKYKAPTEFGFALKHPQIQKKTPKYIKYLCAEDQQTFSSWVTGIRIAKHGIQLLNNYKDVKKNFASWGTREILPNQNFAEYLAKQNERNQEFAKEHHLQPRKSICQLSAQAMGDVAGGRDVDAHSIGSGIIGHERKGSASKMSVGSGDCTPPRKISDAFLGNGSCRRGSQPALAEQRRPSTQSIDYNQNQDYKGSDEDMRTPGKMVPNLPVTTLTTRLLTDQNAASGTLKRRPSQGTMKQLKRSVEDKFLPPTINAQNMPSSQDMDMDDLPLPPPPPEFLHPPAEEVAYSVVNVSNASVVRPENTRIGGSLPNSPQKRPPPPVYAKPHIPGMTSGQAPGHGSPGHQPSSYSAPQSPAPHAAATSSPNHGLKPAAAHRRASSSPAPVPALPENTIYHTPHGGTMKRPPPPPKRSQNTKLSIHGDCPQTQYFISDLQRILDQKQEWSQATGPEPFASFPPIPPPCKPLAPADTAPSMDEWLPPPPAELLVGLQQARRKSGVPPPVMKKTFVPVPRGQH